jgi:hypothetical protein
MRNGKRTSKLNAVTHGILADILLVGDHLGESSETYRRMVSALQKSIRPVDSYEELQVEKLIFLYIRLARVYKADWRLAPKLFEKLEKSIDADHPFVTRELFDFGGEVMGQRKDPTPELLIRYESNIERQIGRTIDHLEQWRMMRPNNSKASAELEEQTANQEGKEALAEDTIPPPATADGD